MQATNRQASARWAPWWAYLVAIVATNLVRISWLQPEEWPTWLEAIVGIGSIAFVVVLVTAVYRATRT